MEVAPLKIETGHGDVISARGANFAIVSTPRTNHVVVVREEKARGAYEQRTRTSGRYGSKFVAALPSTTHTVPVFLE